MTVTHVFTSLQTPGEPSKARGSPTPKEPVAIALNANDRLYTEVRDLNIEVLGTQLQERYYTAHNQANIRDGGERRDRVLDLFL